MAFWRPLSVLLVLLAPTPATADGYFPANPWQTRFCAGLTTELRPGNATRIDCVSSTTVMVVEFYDYWPEAIGQALAASARRHLEPGIVLVCRNDEQHCLAAASGVEATLAPTKLPFSLWLCSISAPSLAECDKRD